MCKVIAAPGAAGCNSAAAMPTLGEIRASIPKHCFERSLVKSLFYTLRSVLFTAGFGAAACSVLPMELTANSSALWVCYAIVQGTIMMGLWVEAHEAGHMAYSSSPIANDAVGFCLHSFLLVPYFSWQKSHNTHHARCNHLLDGETHNPDLKRKVSKSLDKMLHLVFGWVLYLVFHTTGSRRSPVTGERYKRKPNHFSPFASNELFAEKLRFKVLLSSLGVAGMLGLLALASAEVGLKAVALLYFGPYVVVNGWLVLYTWLQHCHPDVPFYGEDSWNWLAGALSTVDRPYPWVVDELHHHIGSTHVCHHVFHELPHYHAVEATAAIKAFLGDHYRFEPMGITASLFQTAKHCHYVEALNGVQYFQSAIDDHRAAQKAKDL